MYLNTMTLINKKIIWFAEYFILVRHKAELHTLLSIFWYDLILSRLHIEIMQQNSCSMEHETN